MRDERVRENENAERDERGGRERAAARGLEEPRLPPPGTERHGERVGRGDEDGVKNPGSEARERIQHVRAEP